MPQEALITIATRHQSHLERLKSFEVRKFDGFLVDMEKQIRDRLTRRDITSLTRVRLEQMLKQVDSLMVDIYADYSDVWVDSLANLAKYEAGFEINSLGQVVEGVNFALPSDSQIMAAVFNTPLGDIGGAGTGSLLKPWLDDMTRTEIKRVTGAIRAGYYQGETTANIVRRIRGTRAAKYTDGVLAIAKRDAEAVTRTALQHAANQSRNEVWARNKKVIRGVKWVSTLDSRTSTICRSLDGQVFPVDSGPRPPAHVNCRSSTTAVLTSKFAGLSKGRTRAMRDPETGKVSRVSADQSYYGWLKGQPAKVQDSIIGPTRGKLLRKGGISAERFAELQLGKNFEPLTLDQMRNIEPTAFEKAGL